MTELNVNSTFDRVDNLISELDNDWGLMTEDMQRLHYRNENTVDRLRYESLDSEGVNTLNVIVKQLEKVLEIVTLFKITNKMIDELDMYSEDGFYSGSR
tara:strand:- start:206 stop:502 length:297 start_codon:yes stop_codon:yes gene_type:complete